VDQAFFSLKRAHHAALKFTRPMLFRFGLTPARFDLIVAASIDSTQAGVRKILGLARATVSEMLARMEKNGLIKREKLGRTRRITLTARAKALFQQACDAHVNSGQVPLAIDWVLTQGHAEIDPIACRTVLASITTMVRRAFDDTAIPTLYEWRREAFKDALLFVAA
jgi:DNA-binding MarR family transcriptional regulator